MISESLIVYPNESYKFQSVASDPHWIKTCNLMEFDFVNIVVVQIIVGVSRIVDYHFEFDIISIETE